MTTTNTRPDVPPPLRATEHGPPPARDHAAADPFAESYVDAVVRALGQRGVLACPPQRTRSAGRLIRSVVIDCTALRIAAWETLRRRDPRASLGAVLQPGHAGPVAITWDQHIGWSAGMRQLTTARSVRYEYPDPFPAPTLVAEFVSHLALSDGHAPALP